MASPEAPQTGAEEAQARLIEEGRRLFAQECRFLRGVAALEQLPEYGLPEVAFAGRSNVGKSSLINALTGRRMLARTSHTPGRTQEINFFELGGRLILVDLPGYGFARAPKEKVKRWTELVRSYLRGRPVLRRTLVLVDSRHGLKPSDLEVMDMLGEAAVNFQVVLTKADKIKPREMTALMRATTAELSRRAAAHPEIVATSSHKQTGIAELRAQLAPLAEETA